MGLGCSEFARHYYRNRGFFLFLQVLRWFTSLSSLLPTYEFSRGYYGFTVVGFPIRTSPDQMPACGFPRLIAACHVLHRFLLPRHPPCALSSLTIKFTQRWNPSRLRAATVRSVSLSPSLARWLTGKLQQREILRTLLVCSSRPTYFPDREAGIAPA